MTIDELKNKYDAFDRALNNVMSLPLWYQDSTRTGVTRNITIEAWNSQVNVLKHAASELLASVSFLKELYTFVNSDPRFTPINESINDIGTRLRTAENSLKTIVDGIVDGESLAKLRADISSLNDVVNNMYTVTTERIAAKAVTTEKIADNAVTVDKIKDNAITAGKIAADLRSKLTKDIEYDPTNGILTFTAFDNTQRRFDFPVEKILKSVELKNETFIFTFADDTVIEVPVGNMLPVWTTDIENATDRELLIPPTAGTVKNELIKKTTVKVNGEAKSVWDATNVIKFAPSTGRRIIAVDPNGAAIGLSVDRSATSNTIVQRSASGEVYGNTTQSSGPTAFVTKDYLYWYTTTAENDTDLRMIPVKGPNNSGFFDVALNKQPLGIPQYDALGQLSANTYPGGTGDMLTNKDWVLANTARPTGFTADDVNKFVVVGPDGELVAKYIPTGGSYGE